MNLEQAFRTLKTGLELNDSYQTIISGHHNAVRKWIESIDSKIKTKLIGSLQRSTRIQPRPDDSFDIDILVILGNFYNWAPAGQGMTPAIALATVESLLSSNKTYRKLDPKPDAPTIQFEYKSGIKIELVPGYCDFIGDVKPVGRGYYVPKQNRWELADYDYDSEYITTMNKNSDGYLIPTIKILKAIRRNHLPLMSSYHLEVLATNIIPNIVATLKNQNYNISYAALIYLFFEQAKKDVLSTSRIYGSKSPPADEQVMAAQKQSLSNAFAQISLLCSEAFKKKSETEMLGIFKALIGNPFPVGD